MNIHYFNINYICNNSCTFCISPSTLEKREGMKIEALNSLNLFPQTDRVIINGGEPTLHPDFFNIIDLFKKNELVLYSNGVRLYNPDFVKKLATHNFKRITIPIHGNEEIHDCITRNKGSYRKTIQGIKNLINCKNQYMVEIKFILTSDLIRSNEDLPQMLKHEGIDISRIDSFILSGLVNSSVCKINNVRIPSSKNTGNYASSLIKKLESSVVKLEEIDFCSLDEELLADMDKIGSFELKNTYEKFIYHDSATPEGKTINYKKITARHSECSNCKFNSFCNSIMDNYHVLVRKDKKWYMDIE